MRCITLAVELIKRKCQVTFICRNLSGNHINIALEKKIKVCMIDINSSLNSSKENNDISDKRQFQLNDFEETKLLLHDDYPDLLIIDHYDLDIIWENEMQPYVSKIMAIDDLGNRKHDCQILLDQNDDNVKKYTKLVPSSCMLLLGPKYVLLRDEFRNINLRKYKAPSRVKRILIFYTSGFDKGETLKALKGILHSEEKYYVDVIVGKNNLNYIEINDICTNNNWSLHIQIDFIAELMSKADLIFGSGGSASWERCVLGIPSVVSILAKNQESIAFDLDRLGAIINLGWHDEITLFDYSIVLNIVDTKKLEKLSHQATKIVNKDGVSMVADKLLTRMR